MKYTNKDGTVDKRYALKIWGFMINTVCEQFNGSTKQEDDLKFQELCVMLGNIAKSK